jgi:erythromycin esterase
VIGIKLPRFRRQYLALLIATACSAQVTAQQGTQSFAKWASNRAVPLDTVEPSQSVSDLRPLGALIGSARLVAIGEPGHGNHEPLSFRNRLFTFLVAEMGFTAIAIESGLAESGRIQEFVAGGPGIASQITRDNLTYGFGSFQENVALVQWIRDYNSDPSHRRNVRFYGIDISLAGPRTATPTPVAVETALSYIARIDAEAASRLRERLQPFLDRLRVTNPESFSEADRDLMTAAIGDLTALLERQRQTFVARTSNAEYEWALRNAISAQQADRVFRLMPPPSTGGVPPTAWRQMTARDEAMAENVQWILEREGPSGRVLIFAHNTHVQSAPTEGGIWGNLERPPETMGQHLRAAFGKDLFILGTAAGGDASGAPAAATEPETVEALLEGLNLPLFVLDLRSAPGGWATEWLAERRKLRAGFTFEIVSPGQAFDALLFMRALTPARRPE